ncbi:MAG: hypothetical protein KJO69_07150 [Gammaproteobacteria bacterium]|nr:hypothetical protein [Gammaproteobacteria bacterium]
MAYYTYPAWWTTASTTTSTSTSNTVYYNPCRDVFGHELHGHIHTEQRSKPQVKEDEREII